MKNKVPDANKSVKKEEKKKKKLVCIDIAAGLFRVNTIKLARALRQSVYSVSPSIKAQLCMQRRQFVHSALKHDRIPLPYTHEVHGGMEGVVLQHQATAV